MDKEDKLYNEHYKVMKYEPLDVMIDWAQANKLSYAETVYYTMVLKYLSRLNLKGAKKKDINKAIDYLLMLKNVIDSEEE